MYIFLFQKQIMKIKIIYTYTILYLYNIISYNLNPRRAYCILNMFIFYIENEAIIHYFNMYLNYF